MIEEIKKRLNAGETVVLECVDRVSFQQGNEFNKSIFRKGSDLIVDFMDDDGDVKVKDQNDTDRGYIWCGELKYFKIKEEPPTFNDLIDVAAQAVKDDKIWLQFLSNDELSFYIEGCDSAIRYVARRNHKRISKEIDFIKSLYTETFVIESEGDILKINDGATVELSNGNSGSVLHVDKHYKTIQFAKEEKHWGALGIFILKGATVTQKRGEV